MIDQALYENMMNHISESRLEKILTVSGERTRYLALVLSGIFYTQNISAVVRSCDCFGIQDLYITGNSPSTHINKHVAQGAYNWVDIHRLTDKPEEQVLKELKEQGYRIVVTLPESDAVSLPDFDLSRGKTAIVMGNEKEGISEAVRRAADEYLTIPMTGFSQSLNISVSAAVIISELSMKLRHSGLDWRLGREDLHDLRYRWMKNSVKRGRRIEEEYLVRLNHPNDQAQDA
ncbi:TrmH family RNA methyltransferase [Spirochaeta isovalerica]|uniref:tRNA (guanosine(18)-2'-O)-methyltransferase n=1 Tax=Spirochaeta isovalerica TaxID=150 RepID=A0A841RCH4_9SPIO|nr:RNA methyltransferase [Spirochaeta isovalerica]MBB6481685.1 tRNA (guanosine-2'-O-)-methyltransferase [Spirochaeta isovalerica]